MALTYHAPLHLQLLSNAITTNKARPRKPAAKAQLCTHDSPLAIYRPVCRSTINFLLAVCLAFGAYVEVSGAEAASHSTAPEPSTHSGTGLRGTLPKKYPHTQTSLTADVSPHEASSSNRGDEPSARDGEGDRARVRESSALSRNEEQRRQPTEEDEQVQDDVIDIPEGIDQEEPIGFEPLEGSLGFPKSLDVNQDLSEHGEDLPKQDKDDLEDAFLDVSSSDTTETEEEETRSSECRPPCRKQRDDVLPAFGDSNDEDELSGAESSLMEVDEAEGADTLFYDDPELESLESESILHRGARVHADTLEENDDLWDTETDGSDTLPIEYTIEKYRDTGAPIGTERQPASAALSETSGTVDISKTDNGVQSFVFSDEYTSAPPVPPASPPADVPASSHRTTTTPGAPPSEKNPKSLALDKKKAPLMPVGSRGVNGEEDLPGMRRNLYRNTAGVATPKHNDFFFMEDDEKATEEEEDTEDEEATGDEEDDAAAPGDFFGDEDSSLAGRGSPEAEVEEIAPEVIDAHQGDEILSAVDTTAREVPSGEIPAAAVQRQALAPHEEQLRATAAEDGAEADGTRMTPEHTKAAVWAQVNSADHQERRNAAAHTLLGPPSFIDWQTLGAVMTSPALRVSGSPFLARAPEYYAPVPTQHTSQQGRIMIVFFGSMVVLLVILLFCCCMVRRKRAHEAYMAEPMIIK